MIQLLLIGSGGFIGSILRFLLGAGVQKVMQQAYFPYGTLTVNLIGCLAIGYLGARFDTRDVLSQELRLFLIVGLLGGFTTFSSFGYETLHLLKNNHVAAAIGYALVSVVVGVIAAWGGYKLGVRV
ncbi:MAG: CrcB protein [Kiritimatiellia bacterium]|jgi:fluoride exporter